ncbi:MAG TPA: hypothetical protein VIV40_03910, partial [Kofleriaceae bacterium]
MRHRRVAQTPDAPADPAPEPTPAPAPEPTPPSSTPVAGARASETPRVTATPNLSDEELAKLSEQDASTEGEEIITVTGSLVER